MNLYQRQTKFLVLLGLSASSLTNCGKQEAPTASLKGDAPAYVNISGAAANILPGVGFDSTRERAHDYCLEPIGELQTLPGTGSGKSVVFEFDKLTSDKTLTDKLNISSSMSVEYLMGGGSAKFDFAKSHVSSENSVTITVNSKVINSERTLGKVTLTKEMQKLYNTNPIAFYDRCGDSFVSGIRTGGEFHAVFEFLGLTSEEKQKIEASFSAHYLTMKADGKMTIENETLMKSSKLKIRIIQSGGEITTPTSIEDFKSAAETFAKSVTAVDATGKPGNSWAMDVTLKGYDKIATTDPANYSKFLAMRKARPIFLALVQKSNRWEETKSQLDYVLENKQEFETYDELTIAGFSDLASRQLDSIRISMNVCLENVTKCALPKLEDGSKIFIPKMKVIPTILPKVIRVTLVSNTTDENEDRNKGYNVAIFNEAGVVVAQRGGVSVGEEYPENTEHSVDIPVVGAGFVPRGLFTARVDAQPENDWNSRFHLVLTVKDGEAIKTIQTKMTGEYRFRPGSHVFDWLLTLDYK